ncbi:hypothetical protein [Streptomyces sp. NPDC058145]|uniref:hypothetical protein n=1 Tax=Streptomyces sp. NPDC058145 TaxID=3346356 RepID=UPI0036EDA9B9
MLAGGPGGSSRKAAPGTGVAGGGFIALTATLSTAGSVPAAGIMLIFGIDKFMSLSGKLPVALARRARRHGTEVHAVAGRCTLSAPPATSVPCRP